MIPLIQRQSTVAAQADGRGDRGQRRTAGGSPFGAALEGIFATFDGQELYPTAEEKGARLGYSLISNHAFVDGNKRIGMYAMLIFLEVNGIRLACSNEDIVQAGLGVASGGMSYEELLQWVMEHNPGKK